MTVQPTDAFELPDFAGITAESIGTLTNDLLAELRARLDALLAGPATFDSLIVGLEELRHELGRRWSPICHLSMVTHTPELQAAYVDALGEVTGFATELGQNPELFAAVDAVAKELDGEARPERLELLRQMLRDFRLAGVGLSSDLKTEFLGLSQRLSRAQATFANHLQQASDAWHWHTESTDAVAGLPDTVLAEARDTAARHNQQGWRFELTQPAYQAVMAHAANRNTREVFYRAWMTRGAAQGEHDPQFDNGPLMREILAIRQRMANLLGFGTYAELSIAPKMAETVGEVQAFLDDLAARSLPTARAELQTLEALAGHTLEAWDTTYYLERLRARDFAVTDEQLRPYFTLPGVIAGVFEVATRLFGVQLETLDGVPAWHSDVDFVLVRGNDGAALGGFYLDLYARPAKRAGAWIDECVVRKHLRGSASLPVGYLVCNVTRPANDKPAQLSHPEVVTLFHEFGHMLHHLLTRVDYPSIAGINGVPWDAVELPSQFMEHYAWQFESLQACSAHADTGEPLPRALFDRLAASRNAGAGLQMLRQLEFAMFDFNLHARADAAGDGVLEEVLHEVRERTTLVKPPAWSRFENGFAHIFAGGYAAGYYSYKWAEVLAADAFSAFDEAGDPFDPLTAARFRQQILEIGGSRDIGAAFAAFRGREPSVDALLRRDGIVAA